jgi:hypothetical protein
MDNGESIRVWLRDRIPLRVRAWVGVPEPDAEGAEITVFVAHVPQAVLDGSEYGRCAGPTGVEGWMGEGVSGLFGTNAMHTIPHPDGDGVLVVGTAV